MTSDHSDRNDEQQAYEDSFRWWKISLVFLIVLMLGLLIGVVPWATFLLRPDWAETFPDKAGLWGDSFGFVLPQQNLWVDSGSGRSPRL